MEPTDKSFTALLIIAAGAMAVAIFFGCMHISEYRQPLNKTVEPGR